MAERTITIRHRGRRSSYAVRVTAGALDQVGDWAVRCLDGLPARAAVISNPTVFGLYGERVIRSLRSAGFETFHWLMRDGERFKDLRSAESALDFLSASRLTRDDVVIALGGGVVGDLAGFAAAIYLRGIRFLQVPTTLLAMIDSSVGGKTGINTRFGKNLVGAFHRPAGVLADIEVLETLPVRELTAGFCEAIKQGAVSGHRLFDETARHLDDFPPSKGLGDRARLVKLTADQISFKACIVRGDETEATSRTDSSSRKILNFGHTFGHALEKATGFRRLRHGEAVGYGMIAAAGLSKCLDLIGQNELNLLSDVVHRAGRLPDIADVDVKAVFEALRFDKKSAAGSINWVLLRGIGKPVIVSEKDIPRSAISRAVRKLLKN